jgi:ribosome-associated translation inhibitor RaiA
VIKAGKQGENILTTADKVKKEIERQVLKIKEKKQENKRRTRKAVREARGKI